MPDAMIRDLTVADAGWFLALNNAAVPHVNALAPADLATMLGEAALAWAVLAEGGEPAGGLIAFAAGAGYDSANYLWFQDRHDAFLYIDRVVIDPASRGRGLGQALYRDAIEAAHKRGVMLCCEVNERPPNAGSMRFHERLGFVPAGRQDTEGGKKSVVLLTLAT
jgi:predicted GNAT superfamily acetyltransferase